MMGELHYLHRQVPPCPWNTPAAYEPETERRIPIPRGAAPPPVDYASFHRGIRNALGLTLMFICAGVMGFCIVSAL